MTTTTNTTELIDTIATEWLAIDEKLYENLEDSDWYCVDFDGTIQNSALKIKIELEGYRTKHNQRMGKRWLNVENYTLAVDTVKEYILKGIVNCLDWEYSYEDVANVVIFEEEVTV